MQISVLFMFKCFYFDVTFTQPQLGIFGSFGFVLSNV